MASDPSTDYLKERIKFLTEILKLIFGVFVLIIAGVIALINKQFTAPSGREFIFIVFGIAIEAPIVLLIYALYNSIDEKIRKLRG